MTEELKAIFYLLKKALIIGLILFFLLVFIGSSNSSRFFRYKRDCFELSMNDVSLTFYNQERYRYFFQTRLEKNYSSSGMALVNEIPLQDMMHLEFGQYESYRPDGTRKDAICQNRLSQPNDFKRADLSKARLQIKRMNQVLYDGVFISDVSPYVKEKGRYYFHITTSRKIDLVSEIVNHLSFNVIVGGGNPWTGK